MNKELFETILVQLEPELAQKFVEEIGRMEVKLKALEIIKELVDIQEFVSSKDVRYVISFKSGQNAVELVEQKYDLLKEVLI